MKTRIKVVYLLQLVISGLLLSWVFLNPILSRIIRSEWGGDIGRSAMYLLDFHVIVSLAVFALLGVQIIVGFRRAKKSRFIPYKKVHKFIGNLLVKVGLPLFALGSLFTVFRMKLFPNQMVAFVTLAVAIYLFYMGKKALDERKIPKHIDLMMAGFVWSSLIAMQRVVGQLLITTEMGASLTYIEVFRMAIVISTIYLTGFLLVAGRFKPNLKEMSGVYVLVLLSVLAPNPDAMSAVVDMTSK